MHKATLKKMSNSGQLLDDFDLAVIVELQTVIKAADIVECDSRFKAFVELDAALQLYKEFHPSTLLVDIVYRQTSQLFDIRVDKVGLEIVSLTLDDLKLLAQMPTS